jgi:hypothetical protein
VPAHRVEVPAGVLGLPVELGIGRAHVGDADLGLDDRVLGGVEGQVHRRRVALTRVGDHARGRERVVEDDVEVDGVELGLAGVVGLPTEVAARVRALDFIVADHLGTVAIVAVLAGHQLDQEVGLARGRIAEARHRAVRRGRELRGDGVRRVALGRVVAGLRHLAGVAERRHDLVRVPRGERAGRRHHRHIPRRPAARAGDVGQAVAPQLGVRVVVPATRAVARHRVRAPLHHPERHVGPGEGVAAARGPRPRIDQARQPSGCRRAPDRAPVASPGGPPRGRHRPGAAHGTSAEGVDAGGRVRRAAESLDAVRRRGGRRRASGRRSGSRRSGRDARRGRGRGRVRRARQRRHGHDPESARSTQNQQSKAANEPV